MTDLTPVMLTHPTDPKLRGPVTFKLPDAYTSVAIGRRLVELTNAGRDPKLPRLHPEELPIDAYRTALVIATLEHVVVTAPAGLYREIGGRAVLNPGALSELEAEEDDGALMLLYAAYDAWRSSFRRRRAGQPAGADPAAGGADDRPGGPQGREEPPGSAGAAQ